MSKAKPLTAEQCEAAREAMLTGHSLSKISRCAGVVATIEYMLKDIRLLETYLQRMASVITQKREQISHSALLLSMFHYEMSSLSLYDPAFKEMLLKAVEQERIIQRKLFVAGNSTEVTPYRDVWKLYEPYGNVLRLKRLDFTAIKRPSLRSEVKYYLLEAKKQQEENRKLCGRAYNKEYLGYVCVDVIGNLIKPNYVSSTFGKLLAKNNLRHIRFHDLRHTCASLLLANGVPMEQVKEWLGHSEISTTVDIYGHLQYATKKQSAAAIEQDIVAPMLQNLSAVSP